MDIITDNQSDYSIVSPYQGKQRIPANLNQVIDIVMAPLFAYLCFLCGRNFGRAKPLKAVPKV